MHELLGINCWVLKQQPTCTICHAKHSWPCVAAEAFASQAEMESSAVTFDYDPDYVDRKYELLSLKVIHRRRRTGFEETKDFPIRVNDLVAGRYQVSQELTAYCSMIASTEKLSWAQC